MNIRLDIYNVVITDLCVIIFDCGMWPCSLSKAHHHTTRQALNFLFIWMEAVYSIATQYTNNSSDWERTRQRAKEKWLPYVTHLYTLNVVVIILNKNSNINEKYKSIIWRLYALLISRSITMEFHFIFPFFFLFTYISSWFVWLETFKRRWFRDKLPFKLQTKNVANMNGLITITMVLNCT